MKLSKSKVNDFLRCRRCFKYRYIDKIEEEPNEYMQRGTDVHNIAELFAKNIDMNGDFMEQLDDIYQSYDTNFDLGHHLVNLGIFFDLLFHDKDTIGGYKIFSVEEYIHDKEHNFSGLSDLVLEDEDGKLTVIDYKTGRSKGIKNYRLELCYYKMLLEYKYPDKEVITAGILFTEDAGTRFINFTEHQSKGSYVTQEDYQAAIKLLDFVRNEVKENRLYPKEQFLCKYCSYYDICQEEGGL